MIVQKDFLNKLRDFGLNTYESKLWTALLSRGISTAGELSDIANVPRSRSYDVLESLEKKGFIIMKLGKPIKYIAVQPSEVLDRVKKKIREDSDKQTLIIEKLTGSEILQELNALHNQGIEMVDPSELSGMLKGRNNLYCHLESMINNSEKSLVVMTTEDGFVRKVDSLITHLKRAKDRGVKIKIAAPMNLQSLKAAKHLAKIAQVKQTDDLTARFLVVDGKQLVLMALNDKDTHPTYDMGIWINSPFLAGAMETMFEKLWPGMKAVKTD
ncbi:MAG: helix-turn-helix domain-containing protein [Candidatus Woesearchaeota archaeon]